MHVVTKISKSSNHSYKILIIIITTVIITGIAVQGWIPGQICLYMYKSRNRDYVYCGLWTRSVHCGLRLVMNLTIWKRTNKQKWIICPPALSAPLKWVNPYLASRRPPWTYPRSHSRVVWASAHPSRPRRVVDTGEWVHPLRWYESLDSCPASYPADLSLEFNFQNFKKYKFQKIAGCSSILLWHAI